MVRRQRKVAKATDVSVHIGVGGTALIIQFTTLTAGEFTIALPLDGARALAQALLAKAEEATALANEGGSGLLH